MSNFKLNALLEITLTINENPPVEELLDKYEKFLMQDLEIGKVVIVKKNVQWECILNSGFDSKICNRLCKNKDLLSVDEISRVGVDTPEFLEGGDYVIPVIHKSQPIAFVIIGDIDEESEGLSPVVKHLRFIQTLSNIIIVAMENIRLYEENLRQVAIKRELELASKMQNILIPANEKLPSNESVHFEAFYHPHFEVGGDYYDVLELSHDKVGFCIADVSGKGISAALLMSNFQANLRALFTAEVPLKKLVELLNERVMESAKGEKFITLFIARYNKKSKKLSFINAGHNPPLMFDIKMKSIKSLKSGCVGMGMLDKLPFIHEESMLIDKPIKLFCYTDGLVELLIDEEKGVSWGTRFIEEQISNDLTIGQNINHIIKDHKIIQGNNSIFDDISILGVDFSGF
jgi:sigma-B regulation protein RsbU (phosphoserine phosphatase)